MTEHAITVEWSNSGRAHLHCTCRPEHAANPGPGGGCFIANLPKDRVLAEIEAHGRVARVETIGVVTGYVTPPPPEPLSAETMAFIDELLAE